MYNNFFNEFIKKIICQDIIYRYTNVIKNIFNKLTRINFTFMKKR